MKPFRWLIVLALFLVGCGSKTGLPPQPPSSEEESNESSMAFGDGNPLLFVSGDGRMEDRHIYLARADGSNAFCLTCGPDVWGAYSFPVWAPDRSAFAFVYGDTEVAIQTSDGRVITLFRGDGRYRDLRWSPDGSRLAFSFEGRQGNGWAPAQVCTVVLEERLSAGTRQCWTDAGYNSSPEWSPDGRFLLFAHRHGEFEQADLFRLDLTDRSVERLTDTPDRSELHPRWYGERILYVAQIGQQTDLWVMRADGREPVCLTPGEEDGNWPEWSPDGTRILFVTSRTSDAWSQSDVPFAGYAELYVMAADGSNPVNLTNNPRRFVTQPSWGR